MGVAVLNLTTVLALIFVVLVSSVIIVNIPFIESVLTAESANRGEFQNAIVILPLLFIVIAYIFSKKW